MGHQPISESEYKDIINIKLPDDGPIEQEKLISGNDIFYYTLTSTTGPNLYSEVSKKGPSLPTCENCAWSYSWSLLWKWDVKEDGVICSMNWANVKVSFNYRMPLWLQEQEASPQLRQRYSIWMKDSWLRINKRTARILQEAASLERSIMALPKQNCAELDRRIKSEGFGTMNKIKTEIDPLPLGGSRTWMYDF